MGHSKKKSKQKGLRIWNYQGYWRKSMAFGKSRGQLKEFLTLEFPRGTTRFWRYLIWKIDFSRISKNKVTNLEAPGFSSVTPCFDFFGNNPILVTPGGTIWSLKLKVKTTEVSICGITNTNIKQKKQEYLLNKYFLTCLTGREKSWRIITK